jgi:HK97 family phage prohead protease
MKPERRMCGGVALRAATPPETWPEPGNEPAWPKVVRGYAARFNALSDDLGGFREMIAPGAFAGVLGDDVRALIDHRSEMILGRTKAGTLRLREDDDGLAVEIDLPDTQIARDLAASMARGDVDQMSFGFTVDRDDWAITEDGVVVRTIEALSGLFDVSVVTFPAYPQTEASLRSRAAAVSGARRRPLNIARARLAAI